MAGIVSKPPRGRRTKASIHSETTNISFIQTAKDLRDLGIQNNMFFLDLYDVSLTYVNPHDPDLSKDQKLAIINECLINPWYFLRECVRISDDGGGAGKPYILNRGNLAATFCVLNHIDHYLVLPRQKGKTQSTIAIILWAYTFGTTNTEMMFINKQLADANNNLGRLKGQRDLLPPFLRMKQIINNEGKIDKGKDNVTTIFNPVSRNTIITKPSAMSMEKAEGLGRGCTQTIQYYDETEFTPFIKTIVEAAGPAFNTASKNAKRNNAAYCRILTSTPGDLDSAAGQDALKIVNGCATWTEQMYDWDEDQIKAYIKTNAENGIVYIEYTYKQLGEGEEWFIEACQKVLNNPTKIKREILLHRIHGSNLSPFEPEEVQAIQELKKTIKEEIYINTVCRVDVYEKLSPTKTYLVGVDCSSGLGVDNHAMTVIDPYSLNPVAEFKSPYLSISDLGRFLHIFIQKYIPRGILCIERNHTGIAVIDMLRDTSSRSRIYSEVGSDLQIDDQMDAHGFLKQQAQNRRVSGVWTGGKSRSLMMSILESRVKENKEGFVTANITSDLGGLIRKSSGRIDHSSTSHDDSMMSFLIGLYVAYHGKSLSKFGFVKGMPEPKDLNGGLSQEPLADSYESIINAMSDEEQNFFSTNVVSEYDAYEREVFEHMQKARQQSNLVNRQLGLVNTDHNLELDQYGIEKPQSLGMDLFDELNDI